MTKKTTSECQKFVCSLRSASLPVFCQQHVLLYEHILLAELS